MLTAQQLIANAKSRIREVSSTEVREMMNRGEPVTLVDIREQNEWNLGHIPGAVHIGRGVLETTIESRVPRDANIVLYCASGNRSALGAVALQEMGYDRVASMAGGIKDWAANGGEIAD